MNLRSIATRSTLTGLTFAAVAACLPTQASAALYTVTFTGVITNSRDAAPFAGVGVVFGGASSGGQNGLVISGSMLVDTGGLVDGVADPSIGSFGPPVVAFPQPTNLITSHYSIAGQTFHPSQYMGPPNGHSGEFGFMQDRFVSHGQQDVFWLQDLSQALLCSNPSVPATCTGGALNSNFLQLKFAGLADFISGDGLNQNLTLDLAALTAITTGPGGVEDNEYLLLGPGYDAAGEFILTALTIMPLRESAMPAPPGLLTLWAGSAVLGVARLFGRSSKRGTTGGPSFADRLFRMDDSPA